MNIESIQSTNANKRASSISNDPTVANYDNRESPKISSEKQDSSTPIVLPSLNQQRQEVSVDVSQDVSNVDSEANIFDETEDKNNKKPAWKLKIAKVLDHWSVVLFMTLITIYALFFDDIRVLVFPKSVDDIFYGITLVAMICYTVEIFFASIVIDDYFLSFFFWLDLVSTISMIPDCGWIWDPIVGGGGENASSATDLAKTSRAGRVTRVIRIIRLIRLIRIVKLYK